MQAPCRKEKRSKEGEKKKLVRVYYVVCTSKGRTVEECINLSGLDFFSAQKLFVQFSVRKK